MSRSTTALGKSSAVSPHGTSPGDGHPVCPSPFSRTAALRAAATLKLKTPMHRPFAWRPTSILRVAKIMARGGWDYWNSPIHQETTLRSPRGTVFQFRIAGPGAIHIRRSYLHHHLDQAA